MTSPAKSALEVGVECYAGHRGEETPRRFTLGRIIEVAEVLDFMAGAGSSLLQGTRQQWRLLHPAERCADGPMGAHHV